MRKCQNSSKQQQHHQHGGLRQAVLRRSTPRLPRFPLCVPRMMYLVYQVCLFLVFGGGGGDGKKTKKNNFLFISPLLLAPAWPPLDQVTPSSSKLRNVWARRGNSYTPTAVIQTRLWPQFHVKKCRRPTFDRYRYTRALKYKPRILVSLFGCLFRG